MNKKERKKTINTHEKMKSKNKEHINRKGLPEKKKKEVCPRAMLRQFQIQFSVLSVFSSKQQLLFPRKDLLKLFMFVFYACV